jgi:hypothetical protein
MSKEFVAERVSVSRFQRSVGGHGVKDDGEAKSL